MRKSLTNRYFQGVPGLCLPAKPGDSPKLGSKNRTRVLPIFPLNGQIVSNKMLDGIRFMNESQSKLLDLGKLVGISLAAVICSLFLYVLSIGPACMLNKRGALPNVVKQAYQPLTSMMERSDLFSRFLNSYQCLWLGVPDTQLRPFWPRTP